MNPSSEKPAKKHHPILSFPFTKNTATNFVILLGVVSLFADATYEGARSIAGPYLAFLGASGMVVGFVAGFGELIGYGLRLLSGYLSDRTHRYWAVTLLGYAINLLAVPLLALAGRWEVAAALWIAERVGKAIRTPARDAMLSYATKGMGRGWGFGLHEAMDQIGAIAGPMLVAWVMATKTVTRLHLQSLRCRHCWLYQCYSSRVGSTPVPRSWSRQLAR